MMWTMVHDRDYFLALPLYIESVLQQKLKFCRHIVGCRWHTNECKNGCCSNWTHKSHL